MKESFIEHSFSPGIALMLEHVNRILDDYAGQGYKLTLRQLFYQMVSLDLFPDDRKWRWTGTKWVRDPNGTKNAQPNYKWLGDIVTDGRLAGLVDWEMIEDRGRELVENAHWGSPAEIVEACAKQFRVDKWANQPCHVEVMVEKQALEGILIPVCKDLDIPFTANKGYSSSSALYEAGKRMLAKAGDGKKVHVIYLGDHDPSGIDMTRDVQDRLNLFSRGEFAVEMHRVALNIEQVQRLSLPENPTKMDDSRAAAYIERFGHSSWELDALEPRALVRLVRDQVRRLRDQAQWNADAEREATMKAELQAFADDYGNEGN